MSFFLRVVVVGVLLGEMGECVGWAADLSPTALEQIVRDSTTKYVEHFAREDAAALAELFTPEAEYVNSDGVIFHGRAAIETELAASFKAGPAGKLEIEVVSIRPIADGIVVEEGGSTFTPNDDGPILQTRYVALHARHADGTWLLAAVRELAPAELTPHERLKALTWLVGEWREEVDAGVTQTSWKWSDDGIALLADFTTRDPEGAARSGTHRIGWDAERKQFRSWIFDSTGGFADGWWTPDADGNWSVRLVGVDAEGERIAATLVYSTDGPDRLTIAQHDRVRGGVSLPSTSTRVVRRPPLPGTSAAK